MSEIDVNKLIQSIKEFTKEEINNLNSIKPEISKLLKTHRPIKLTEYEYGISSDVSTTKDHRLIIREKDDRSKVREYLKNQNYWYCNAYCSYSQYYKHRCSAQRLIINYGIVFAPKNHSTGCETKEYTFAMEVQDLLKKGKIAEAKWLKRKSVINTSNQSFSTSILNESSVSTTDIENESNLEEPLANDTTVNIDSENVLLSPPTSSSSLTENGPTINMNSTLISDLLISNDTTSAENSNITSTSQTPISEENVPESVRTSVKRELDDEDDCMIIDEPFAKKPKIEPTNSETFSFDQPSAATLKEMCKKLNVKYCNDAYKFWGEIIFENILPASDNIKTHSIKSKNIFACFSQFFTGKVNSCYFLQDIINKAFCEELIESGIETSETEQIFLDYTVSDRHLKFIAKFLSCKIGIYENGILKKYGNWEIQNYTDILNLILSFENGLYSVVLDL
uniref:Uncharacterized protein n=1 Tax=Panagrolaimus sp. PS1159 TaxID=55785 RepID=A0AC35GWU2_9BILA